MLRKRFVSFSVDITAGTPMTRKFKPSSRMGKLSYRAQPTNSSILSPAGKLINLSCLVVDKFFCSSKKSFAQFDGCNLTKYLTAKFFPVLILPGQCRSIVTRFLILTDFWTLRNIRGADWDRWHGIHFWGERRSNLRYSSRLDILLADNLESEQSRCGDLLFGVKHFFKEFVHCTVYPSLRRKFLFYFFFLFDV